MKSRIALLSGALILSMLAGCKKENIRTNDSKTKLLTQKPWILTAYTITRISDGYEQDGFSPMTACYRDDQYVFKADKTFEGNAGKTKCNASDPQVFQMGSWQFTQNETMVERTITSGINAGQTTLFKVMELTTNTLKLNVEDGDISYTATYNH